MSKINSLALAAAVAVAAGFATSPASAGGFIGDLIGNTELRKQLRDLKIRPAYCSEYGFGGRRGCVVPPECFGGALAPLQREIRPMLTLPGWHPLAPHIITRLPNAPFNQGLGPNLR